MDLECKLELLNAVAGGANFPTDRVYRDGVRLVATNGFQLLAIQVLEEEAADFPTLGEGAKASRRESAGKSVDAIRRWLMRGAPHWVVSSRSLLQFLRAEKYLQCPYCGGCGKRPTAEPETDFDGLVDEFDERRSVIISSAPFNANMLVSTLAYLPAGGTLMLSTWADEREHGSAIDMLRIAGDGWTIVQASLADEEREGAEVFPLDPAAGEVANEAKA